MIKPRYGKVNYAIQRACGAGSLNTLDMGYREYAAYGETFREVLADTVDALKWGTWHELESITTAVDGRLNK